MFQFSSFASVTYVLSYGYTLRCGFPHSDICGSMCICHSPQLFAAYHVFHRLSVPRHPPCALFSLTNNLKAVLIGLPTAEVYFPLPEERLDLICEAKDTKKALPSSNRSASFFLRFYAVNV